mgnify:CR=1 FL=1
MNIFVVLEGEKSAREGQKRRYWRESSLPRRDQKKKDKRAPCPKVDQRDPINLGHNEKRCGQLKG